MESERSSSARLRSRFWTCCPAWRRGCARERCSRTSAARRSASAPRSPRKDRVVFIGGHPMAGTEFPGFVAPTRRSSPAARWRSARPSERRIRKGGETRSSAVRDLWTACGADRLLDVEPDVHDRAITNRFPSSLPGGRRRGQALPRVRQGRPRARAGRWGFRDTTRLAGDGTVGGAAALNRFVPGAARALADRLRALAQGAGAEPGNGFETTRLGGRERRRMRMPPAAPLRRRAFAPR